MLVYLTKGMLEPIIRMELGGASASPFEPMVIAEKGVKG